MSFIHYRTKGFFLKSEEKGESDRLFSVFTQDFGKIEVLGRAIRKINSKLRTGADFPYLSEIEFIQGKRHKTLTDAIAVEKFKKITNSQEKLRIMHEMSGILDYLAGFEEKDEEIWNLFGSSLSLLSRSSSLTLNTLIRCFFSWKLFSILGYAPELYSCPICSKKLLPETFYFFPEEGGVVCWKCLKIFPGENKLKIAKLIGVDAVKILRIIIKKEISCLEKLRISEKDLKNLEEITGFYKEFLKEEFSKKEKME